MRNAKPKDSFPKDSFESAVKARVHFRSVVDCHNALMEAYKAHPTHTKHLMALWKRMTRGGFMVVRFEVDGNRVEIENSKGKIVRVFGFFKHWSPDDLAADPTCDKNGKPSDIHEYLDPDEIKGRSDAGGKPHVDADLSALPADANALDVAELIAPVLQEIQSKLTEEKNWGTFLHPSQIFSKMSATEQLLVHIDSEIECLRNNKPDDKKNPEWFLLCYLVLLRAARRKDL